MTDKEIRERLGKLWDRQEIVIAHLAGLPAGSVPKLVCCGGRGLVVGCPRCGKRWK